MTPAFLVAGQVITVDGAPVKPAQMPRLFAMHKPPGCLVTNSDPQNRPTVFQLIPKGFPRLIAVGRLDFNTEGLLLLTTCGRLARELELPSSHLERTYRVKVRGALPDDMMRRAAAGLKYKGIAYRPARIKIDSKSVGRAWLIVTLTEGKNHEVKNILAAFGLTVERLIRTSYGPHNLGDLEPGNIVEIKGCS
ncbi:MAG: pseudouridine synthase [Alphaproteobacteria bacterium]|nr:pseudouridine synthase [Alphaproteobacteria bacterium]